MEILPEETELFRNISRAELSELLDCLGVRRKKYLRGEIILLEGTVTKQLGVVLSGRVIIEMTDLWGGRSIIGQVGAGGTFGEAYACVPEEPMLVTVIAAQDTQVLLIHVHRVLKTCPKGCAFHSVLIENLLSLCARKNLQLSRRMQYTAPKTIRGRLISYFSDCAKRAGSRSFTIPYNRQQLADYLSVDRSALSAELSRMQKEGLILYRKNRFEILEVHE